METETKPEHRLGSSRAPSRRDYFVGCALQALVRTRPLETDKDRITREAIEWGNLTEAQIIAEDAKAAAPAK